MSLPDKFSTFCGTQSFISTCTSACHWSLLSDRGHVVTFHVASSLQVVAPTLYVHFSSWCACHVYTQLSHVCITISLVFGKEHKFPVTQFAPSDSSPLLSPNCLFCIHFLSMPVLFPECQGDKFHTYTKQHARVFFVHVVSTFVFLDRFWIGSFEHCLNSTSSQYFHGSSFCVSLPNVATIVKKSFS
jgi:hypothetical protein